MNVDKLAEEFAELCKGFCEAAGRLRKAAERVGALPPEAVVAELRLLTPPSVDPGHPGGIGWPRGS